MTDRDRAQIKTIKADIQRFQEKDLEVLAGLMRMDRGLVREIGSIYNALSDLNYLLEDKLSKPVRARFNIETGEDE